MFNYKYEIFYNDQRVLFKDFDKKPEKNVKKYDNGFFTINEDRFTIDKVLDQSQKNVFKLNLEIESDDELLDFNWHDNINSFNFFLPSNVRLKLFYFDKMHFEEEHKFFIMNNFLIFKKDQDFWKNNQDLKDLIEKDLTSIKTYDIEKLEKQLDCYYSLLHGDSINYSKTINSKLLDLFFERVFNYLKSDNIIIDDVNVEKVIKKFLIEENKSSLFIKKNEKDKTKQKSKLNQNISFYSYKWDSKGLINFLSSENPEFWDKVLSIYNSTYTRRTFWKNIEKLLEEYNESVKNFIKTQY